MDDSQQARYPTPNQKDVLNTSENLYLNLISEAPVEYNFSITSSSNHRYNDTAHVKLPIQAAIDHLSYVPTEIDPLVEGVLNLSGDLIPTSISYLQFNLDAFITNLVLGTVSSRTFLEQGLYYLQAIRDGNATVDYLGNVSIISLESKRPNVPEYVKKFAANLVTALAPVLATQASPTNATWYQYQAYKLVFLDDDVDAFMGMRFYIKDIVFNDKSWPVTLFDYQEWVRTHNMWTFMLPTSSISDMLLRLRFLASIAAYSYGKRLQTNSNEPTLDRHWATTCQVPNDDIDIELSGVSNRLVQTFQDLANSCALSMLLISYYLTIKDEFGQHDEEDEDDDEMVIGAFVGQHFSSTTIQVQSEDSTILT